MPGSPLSDASAETAALLKRTARGDEQAWRDLIARYGRRVHALVKSRCRRDDLAEEITQSVFVTIATTLSSGGYSEQGRFESWLFRVAMNRVRDEIRRQRRQATPADPSTLSDAFTAPADAERPDPQELQSLRDAMTTLSEPDREVIELRHHAGLGFKEIAEMLGQPLGTVLARHHRALRKMKEWIESCARPAPGPRQRGIA